MGKWIFWRRPTWGNFCTNNFGIVISWPKNTNKEIPWELDSSRATTHRTSVMVSNRTKKICTPLDSSWKVLSVIPGSHRLASEQVPYLSYLEVYFLFFKCRLLSVWGHKAKKIGPKFNFLIRTPCTNKIHYSPKEEEEGAIRYGKRLRKEKAFLCVLLRTENHRTLFPVKNCQKEEETRKKLFFHQKTH